MNPWWSLLIGVVVGLALNLAVAEYRSRRAAKREESMAAAQWHIVDVPVHDPDSGELLGWVPTRSDTGEALPQDIYGINKDHSA